MNIEESAVSLRSSLNAAISYWESKRLIFNAVLFLIVGIAFIAGWPVSARVLGTQWMLLLFILAVLANVAYCAAYLPDVALQHSSFRALWLRTRWALLALGTLFAGAITFLFVSGHLGLAMGTGKSR